MKNEQPHVAAPSLEKFPLYLSFFLAASFLLSVVFNVGYFWPLGLKFLGFFSLQDYLEGSIAAFIGGGAISVVYFAPAWIEREESVKQLFLVHKKLFCRLNLIGKIITFPIVLLLFLVQLLGVLFLYVGVTLFTLSNLFSLRQVQAHELFRESLYLIGALFLGVLVCDMLIKAIGDPKKKTIIFVYRVAAITAYLMFMWGIKTLALDMLKEESWIVQYTQGKPVAHLTVVRSISKGVLLYDKEKNSITLIDWSQIHSLTKQLKERQ